MNDAQLIVELALSNMGYIVPALVILSSLAVADQLADFAVNLVKRVRKEYKL